jgi:hypothetical protein
LISRRNAQSAKWEKKEALIVVRTYPIPAQTGVEVSCTAAITADAEWLRLFPVPWRYLSTDKRFRRYQWVEVSVAKASDSRPESYRLNPDGIQILSEPLSTARSWRARKDIVLPLQAHCLCCLIKERNAKHFPTLGIFRPRAIEQLIIKAESSQWTSEQLVKLRQGQLFRTAPMQELEKIPYSFRYHFRCDHEDCKGHKLTCTDWEMGESYRKWKRLYKGGWEQKFRQRYEQEMIEKYDTHFYVGTVHGHPHTWIICGLFYPPYTPPEAPTLFPLGTR